MSAKAKSWISFVVIFAIVIGSILLLEWSSWSNSPINALYWALEVVGLIVLVLLFAPVIFRLIMGLEYIYVVIGTHIARFFLGLQAALAAEKGETETEFLQRPLFRSSLIQRYLSYMRFGGDRETINQSLTPGRVSTWIIFGWPLVLAPLVLEETTPIFLFALGLAPVIARHLVRRRGEVEDVIAKAFSSALPDSSRQVERH